MMKRYFRATVFERKGEFTSRESSRRMMNLCWTRKASRLEHEKNIFLTFFPVFGWTCFFFILSALVLMFCFQARPASLPPSHRSSIFGAHCETKKFLENYLEAVAGCGWFKIRKRLRFACGGGKGCKHTFRIFLTKYLLQCLSRLERNCFVVLRHRREKCCDFNENWMKRHGRMNEWSAEEKFFDELVVGMFCQLCRCEGICCDILKIIFV